MYSFLDLDDSAAAVATLGHVSQHVQNHAVEQFMCTYIELLIGARGSAILCDNLSKWEEWPGACSRSAICTEDLSFNFSAHVELIGLFFGVLVNGDLLFAWLSASIEPLSIYSLPLLEVIETIDDIFVAGHRFDHSEHLILEILILSVNINA